MTAKHFHLTVVGPDERHDIHHHLVEAPSAKAARAFAIAHVKARYGYARARISGDVVEVVAPECDSVRIVYNGQNERA